MLQAIKVHNSAKYELHSAAQSGLARCHNLGVDKYIPTRPAIVEKPIAIKSDPIPISLEDRFPEQLSWNSKKRFPNFDMVSIDLEPTLEFTL